jgi:membrane protein implicated in regulation of membrane protease activity
MKEIKLGRTAVTFILISIVVFLAACERKTINQILAEPSRYTNREVGIEGNVVDSYSVLGRGVYRVDDGTGKLWIVSDKGVPRKGSRVGVKGKIQDGFDLGSLVKLPEAVSSGLVMIESSHRAE